MTTWFDTARFGMFVHWGISSVPGWELSWPLVGGNAALPHCQKVSIDEYHANASRFDPKAFDPSRWARTAKRLGMQYAVLTSRHHDGFSMYDTKLSDFSVMRSPHGRDVVRSFVDAFRAEGLRVGLYYSLSDWHHPDYPAFREADKPYDFGRLPQPSPEQWERYLAYMFGQVRELLTNYGPIATIWFDGQWERAPFDRWKPQELRSLIKSLQPECLINDRLPGAGDFETPEQFVPPTPPGRTWETCMTMNESWGWSPSDTQYKSGRQLIHTLCEVAGRGGNLLLNVGPMGTGELPPEQVERLEVVAGWMKRNGESIVGTTAGLEPWQFYGPSTRRGDRIYLHLLMKPYDTVSVRGLPIRQIRRARALGTDVELQWSGRAPILDTLFGTNPIGEIAIAVPDSAVDPHATVIAIDLEPAT